MTTTSRTCRAHGALLLLAALHVACGNAPPPLASRLRPEPGEELSGGELTVFDSTNNAFGRPAPTLSGTARRAFFGGNATFNDGFTAAEGLGPTFNVASCSGCHFKDGRGAPEDDLGTSDRVLLRLSVPGEGTHGAPRPEPRYGSQLGVASIEGTAVEGALTLHWKERPGAYGDGEPYSLREPSVDLERLAHGGFAPGTQQSLRVPPAVVGMGLLEAVPESTLAELADPEDADGDGISGRLNRVWDPVQGSLEVGRFGWKASERSVLSQTASAFLLDMGLTSSWLADLDCQSAQEACEQPPPNEPELADRSVERVVAYLRGLGVPARRDWNAPEVLRGKQLFFEAGCEACHTSRLLTGDSELPELAGQLVRPYTDLLLHNVGMELSDGRPEFQASGTEWRTAPLWGIGLIERVNGHTFLLHDGRARDLAEAILWHGGEAEAAKQSYRLLPQTDRRALLAFLRSL